MDEYRERDDHSQERKEIPLDKRTIMKERMNVIHITSMHIHALGHAWSNMRSWLEVPMKDEVAHKTSMYDHV